MSIAFPSVWHAGRDCLLDEGATATGRHAWERGMRVWHLLFLAMLAGLVVAVWFARDLTTGERAAVTGLLAAMVVWYVALVPPVHNGVNSRRAVVYLAGMLALFSPLAAVFPLTLFLLSALCPQMFMLLQIRWALVGVVAFNGIPALYRLSQGGWKLRAVLETLAWGSLMVAFSMTFALWIRGIIRQSVERAELIDRLEATRTELAAANHEAGVLAERERLAAEIHDTLAQGFTSVLMLLQAVESEIERSPAEGRRHLDLAQRTARENLAEARTLVAALAPARLEETSLVEALHRLVTEVGHASGISTEFEVTGEAGPLPAGLEVVLLRATQEALANVRKHAGASRVTVGLHYGGDTILVVSDDGNGFEPAEADGHGLRGLRARAQQVGGAVEITSVPECGTTTRVRLP